MKRVWTLIGVLVILVLAGREARSQGGGGAQFTLTVSPSPFVFQYSDPPADCMGDPLTVGYKAAGLGSKKDPTNNWHLSVRADRDLELSTDLTTFIPISNVHWTATAPFTASGVLSRSVDQTLLSATGNMTAMNYSTITFFLTNNSWTFKAGTYNTTITFSLSAP